MRLSMCTLSAFIYDKFLKNHKNVQKITNTTKQILDSECNVENTKTNKTVHVINYYQHKTYVYLHSYVEIGNYKKNVNPSSVINVIAKYFQIKHNISLYEPILVTIIDCIATGLSVEIPINENIVIKFNYFTHSKNVSY